VVLDCIIISPFSSLPLLTTPSSLLSTPNKKYLRTRHCVLYVNQHIVGLYPYSAYFVNESLLLRLNINSVMTVDDLEEISTLLLPLRDSLSRHIDPVFTFT